MALPKAVQQQVDFADQTVAEMTGTPPAPAADTAPKLVETPPVAPERPVQKEVSEDTWEARYHSLQGKYNAEVPRLSAEIRDLKAVLSTVVSEAEAAKTREAQRQVQAAPIVTDAEREAFGGDLVDLVDRVAQKRSEVAASETERLRLENEKLQKQMNNVQEQVAAGVKDRFFQQLTEAVPNWKVQNNDQGFLDWLAEVDPVYGLPRKAALDHAYGNWDVNRVAHIFEQYRSITEPTKSPRQELVSQVAPSTSRSGTQANVDPMAGKIWTNADIARVYDDVRRGVLHGEEATRYMEEIDAAIAEGRVR